MKHIHSFTSWRFFTSWPAIPWYGLLTGLAGRLRHPRAAVRLHAYREALSLHYHGLGGDLGRGVAADAGARRAPGRGTHGGKDLLAWLDRDRIHLPERINRFPTPALNRELYFWLVAFFALDRPLASEDALPEGLRHLLRGLATSARVVERFPALAPRYERLCAEELAQRREALPALGDDPEQPAHQLEAGIRYALGAVRPPAEPWLRAAVEEARHGRCATPPPYWRRVPAPFLPVCLWGRPRAQRPGLRLRWLKRRMRRRTQGFGRSLASPRFDPERRVDRQPDQALRGGRLYPEWDCRRGVYRADWCRVTEQVPPPSTDGADFDPDAAALARHVRRRFEALREIRGWTRGLENGDEPDLDAFVDSVADRRSRGVRNLRLYRRREHRLRDLSVAVLLDASRSTAAWIGEHRVIEVARQSMAVLAEALAAAGDEFALYGFASDSRLRVRCHRLKDFGERYDDRIRRRLRGLGPGDYTRMGAAIRHVGGRLRERARARKLMLVITDGRPHDPTDRYEGRYALEDTRRALQEIRVQGVQCFGLTIDRSGRAWLPHLFGPGHYAVFSRLDALPTVLPRLYARITASGE